ncbi:hypothetical protein [Roseibium aggregatum]|uniref:hypothetical protein n=1 Tax=Roseibium aggregatum TaxID=187304 RepID=UPI0018DD59FD|nr:hypothetical protein [Roseibium aggregatum]
MTAPNILMKTRIPIAPSRYLQMSFLVSRRSLSDKKEKEHSPFEGKTKSNLRDNPNREQKPMRQWGLEILCLPAA